jgi:trigger factor
MNTEVSRLPESRVTLKIELTPEEVEAALNRTYKQLVQRVNIPGFRKGKAPRSVLERMIGPEVFLHEATDEAVRWGYRKAVEAESLTPIDQAEIDVSGDDHAHIHPGEPFAFEATVAVKPQVELPDYHTIRVERQTPEVTEEDVQNLVDELRERVATLEPVTRPAQVGDVITMNITARVGGEEVVNEENADFPVREADAEDAVFPGLSAELVGAAPGDIREISLPLPATYPREEWAGKTMFLRILVKEVKRTVLPEENDELAQSVSSHETMAELRDTLRANLLAERRMEADEALVRDSIDALTSRTFVEIPPVLIDEELDRMIDDLRRAFGQQQFTLDLYLQSSNQSEESLRNEMREGATDNVKRSLVLGALADAESVDVTNRDVDAALEDLFRGMRVGAAERRRLRSSATVRSNIRSRIRRQRAIQRLVEIVTGGEGVSPEAAEIMADQTASAAEDSDETMAVEIGG